MWFLWVIVSEYRLHFGEDFSNDLIHYFLRLELRYCPFVVHKKRNRFGVTWGCVNKSQSFTFLCKLVLYQSKICIPMGSSGVVSIMNYLTQYFSSRIPHLTALKSNESKPQTKWDRLRENERENETNPISSPRVPRLVIDCHRRWVVIICVSSSQQRGDDWSEQHI